MASTAGLALGEAPIKLIPSYKEEDLIHIDLTHSFLVGGTTEKRKAKLLKLTEDVSSPDFTELLCRLVIEFEDAAGNERLRLTTGPLLFAKFRECLGTTFRTDFDRLRVVHPQTVAGFEAVKIQFLNEYIPTTAAMDQVQYLRTTKKPYSMTVTALGMKLRQINRYGTKFNGQDGQPLFSPAHNDRDLKTVLFTMMKDRWQVNFMNGGREVTEETLAFQALVRLMQTQENNHNRIFGRGGPNQGNDRQGGQYQFNDREDHQSQDGYYQYNDNQYNNNGHYDYNNNMMGQGQYQYNSSTSQGENPHSYRRYDNGGRASTNGGKTNNGRGYFGGRNGNYNGYNGGGSYNGYNGGGRNTDFNNGSSYNGGRGFQGRGYQGRGSNGHQGRGSNGYQGRGSNSFQQGWNLPKLSEQRWRLSEQRWTWILQQQPQQRRPTAVSKQLSAEWWQPTQSRHSLLRTT